MTVPHASHITAPPRVVARRFELIERLGGSVFGALYLARDKLLGGESVVIKIFNAQLSADRRSVSCLKREVVLARRLTHPGIAQIYEFGTEGGAAYLVREHIEGVSLDRWAAALPESERWPRIASVARQIADAIQFAHRHRILHRDLTPANVIITADDRAVIADFGLAQSIGRAGEVTGTGEALGDPEYLAPELFRGARATVAADIYSFGLLLHVIASGRTPYAGESYLRIAERKLTETPARLIAADPSVPRWLDSLAARCLALEPAERPVSPAEHIAVAPVPLHARLAGPRARRAVRIMRRYASYGAAFAACAPVVAAVLVYSNPFVRRTFLLGVLACDKVVELSNDGLVFRTFGLARGQRAQDLLSDIYSSAPDQFRRLQFDLLLRLGANINGRTDDGVPCIVRALDRESGLYWIKHSLTQGLDPNLVLPDGSTLSHVAARKRNITAMTLLLSAGADVDALDAEGRPALHLLMNDLRPDHFYSFVSSLLEKHRGHPELRRPSLKSSNGDTMLHLLADVAEVELGSSVRPLIGAFPELACARDAEGRTPLVRAARARNVWATEALLRGYCISTPDNHGRTALMYAASGIDGDARSVTIVRSLIRRGVPVDAVDRDGRQALDYATERGFSEGAFLLRYAGAEPASVTTTASGGSGA